MGASRSRTKIQSPLNQIRLDAGLSIPALAEEFATSTASIARWLSGERKAPPKFLLRLQQAAADPLKLAAAQAAFAKARKRHKPPKLRVRYLRFRHLLPPDVTAPDAERACVAAIAGLVGEVTHGI